MYSVQQTTTQKELEAIYELRYDILRKPWDQPRGSEHDELDGTAVNAYIADANGTAIACGRLQQNTKELGQIRYMAVHENYRGKGLAKMILRFLETKAREMKLSTIELQARENALDFYKSQGYGLHEKTALYWGKVQHYRMSKSLAH